MSTFDNLVAEAAGGPLIDRYVREVQEGTTWELHLPVIELLDDNGDYTEVDMTGVTCEWKVLSKSNGGTVVLTLETSLTSDNQWQGFVSEDDTAELAQQYVNPARTLPWFCTLTDPDGREVSVFGPHDSRIIIKQGE